MRINRRLGRFAAAFSLLSVLAIPVGAAPLPIQATAITGQAAAGSQGDAYILVYVANEDGTPKTDAEIPGQDPNGGVELRGSKWSFETIAVPVPYKGRGVRQVRPGQQVQEDVAGQLRITEITPAFKKGAAGDTRAGFYWFRIFPAYGYKGGRKALLPWVSGTYLFRVSYKEGSNQGTALGSLTIR